ncbi:MAG TPA: DsbA family protein [Pseudomonadales bacterium]
MATLYYLYDPMCSWCWAYRPVLAQIDRALANRPLQRINLLGGLAADSDAPMPPDQQQHIQAIWRQIEQETGTRFNHRFWRDCQPRRSTYPACRAVLAAEQQQAGDAMIDAIGEAYYQRAMNPSDEDTLLQLADELGLDFDRFAADLVSPAVDNTLQQQITQVRSMPADGFPCWVLEQDGSYHRLPLDYHSAHVTLAALSDRLRPANED